MGNNTKPAGMRDYIGYAMGDFGCNMWLCADNELHDAVLYSVHRRIA